MPDTKETILEEAARIVYGDREETYGHPAHNFLNIAKILEVVLGHPVTLKQVALVMVALKLARECHKGKRDNLVDMAGYIACIDKMVTAGCDIEAKIV